MYNYLIYFLAFSFFGWCAEVIFYIIKEHRFVNRGLAKGPICPIYGVGISLSYLLLGGVESLPLLVLLCAALTSAVEFAVGLLTDKVMGVRLWDYRREKGNICGYVCPRFSVLWGVISAFTVKLIPRFDGFLEVLSEPRIAFIVFSLLILSLVDAEREMIKIIKGTKKA